MYGMCRSRGGLPGVVFVLSGAYDTGKVRLGLQTGWENLEGRPAMASRGSTVQMMGILSMVVLMASCSNVTTQTPPMLGFRSASPLLPIPANVQRMVVLYPRGETPEWSSAYSRLEGAAFQLRAFRPHLRIIDRSHLPIIVAEQRFQVGGLVSEESAVRIGRMLGVDSVLIYRIDGPTLRDRFFARTHRDLPPVIITSKIIRVESGEVVYHNVVTARVDETEESGWSLSDNVDYQRWSREAVDRGVTQTVDDLCHAFE
jgi:hypothetical protein